MPRASCFALPSTGTLHYLEHGYQTFERPSVLMLHSLFFDGSMFDQSIAALDEPWHILCPTHRGQGDTESDGAPVSMQRLAEDYLALIDSTFTAPIHLVGSSMGGYVALALLAMAPDRFCSVTLSCCTALAEQQPERFAALENALRHEGPAQHVDTLMHTMFGDDFLRSSAPDVAFARSHWRARFAALPSSIADAVAGVFSRPDYVDGLHAIKQPTLLLSGNQDHAKSSADMAYMDERLPHSVHRIAVGSGHTIPVEAPAFYARTLEAFWHDSHFVV